MGGHCNTGSILWPAEEAVARLFGYGVADSQPLCRECGRPMRRSKDDHAVLKCACWFWVAFDFTEGFFDV